MAKKFLGVFLVICLLFSGNSVFGSTGTPPTAKSALIIDRTSGEVLFSRSPNIKLAPASTTKILTALVVVDELPLNHIVNVSSQAVGVQPSRINLRAGEQFYVRDLLKALLINSANDAAVALAVAVSGSEWRFAQKMNQKAKSLGALNSNFVHASGLPAENQYSTVSDLIQIFRALETNAFLFNTLASRYAHIESLGGRRIRLKNHNKMLWRDERAINGKTGWTRNARHCFVGEMRHNGKSCFVAILGSKKTWPDLAYFADRFIGGSSSKVVSRSSYSVHQIQRALKNAGYFKVNPTGYFGRITKRAVIRFQKAHRLRADGIVGKETWRALSKYL